MTNNWTAFLCDLLPKLTQLPHLRQTTPGPCMCSSTFLPNQHCVNALGPGTQATTRLTTTSARGVDASALAFRIGSAFDIVFVDFSVQRGTADPQKLRRFGNAIAGPLERIANQLSFPIIDA